MISSYIRFVRKVKESDWTDYVIRKKFMEEVDKGDYEDSDMEGLFEHLYLVAKSSQKNGST